MRISLAAAPMPGAWGKQRTLSIAPAQMQRRDTVLFAARKAAEPRFIAPMVLAHVPEFDPGNPQIVSRYKNLMAMAQSHAMPDVSGRKVGAVVVGESGRVYLGGNIEVKGSAPGDVIHAEAFALTLARQHGEKGVKLLFQSLQPCGSCRQIIRELGDENLPLYIVDGGDGSVKKQTIGQLFPFGYSYANPGMNMLKPPVLDFELEAGQPKLSPMEKKAFQSGRESYLGNPGRKTWAGMALKLKNGKVFTGNTANISGPNPTITPLQDVMVKLVSAGHSLKDIATAVLVEPEGADYSFAQNNKALLEKISPEAVFRHRTVRTVKPRA